MILKNLYLSHSKGNSKAPVGLDHLPAIYLSNEMLKYEMVYRFPL